MRCTAHVQTRLKAFATRMHLSIVKANAAKPYVDRFAAEERCVTTTILRSDARLVTDSPIWNVVMC
jgi:hypothetical protein